MPEHINRVRSLLRRKPKVNAKEKDARRIEIECLELPGEKGEDYIVTVWPKDKGNEPGRKHSDGPSTFTEPIKRVFKSEEETLAYLKKVL